MKSVHKSQWTEKSCWNQERKEEREKMHTAPEVLVRTHNSAWFSLIQLVAVIPLQQDLERVCVFASECTSLVSCASTQMCTHTCDGVSNKWSRFSSPARQSISMTRGYICEYICTPGGYLLQNAVNCKFVLSKVTFQQALMQNEIFRIYIGAACNKLF